MKRVAVIGAGIAGLAAAHRLAASCDVVVFESAGVPGGKIHSQPVDGFLFEWGPNGFLANAAELRALAGELGLDGELTEASPAAANRFIFWGGRLHQLPAKPQQALGLTLLSPTGKLRALGELAVRPSRAAGDESVAQFFTRRFGREVAERIVAPALFGISGGDAAATSVGALLPRVRELEREHGSVIRGMMRSRSKPGRLTSFGAAGLQRLTDRLAERLGARVRLDSPCARLVPAGPRWRIDVARDAIDADAVIVATPAPAAAGIVEGFDPQLARTLERIAYAPMRVAGVAFRSTDVAGSLDGFGFLAARGQGVRILGALYTSTIFPAQAPAGTVYLRIFLGGAADPEVCSADAASVRAIVLRDLATALGITAEPIAYHEAVWPSAIPQYAVGHPALVGEIEAMTRAHPGLAFVGNAYRGLGLGDNVRDAFAVADRVAAAL